MFITNQDYETDFDQDLPTSERGDINSNITEERQKILDEIKEAQEELNFLSEYEELLNCDFEEVTNGGVYGNILQRIEQQILVAKTIVSQLED